MRTNMLTYARGKSTLGTREQANALVDVTVHKLEQTREHLLIGTYRTLRSTLIKFCVRINSLDLGSVGVDNRSRAAGGRQKKNIKE